MADHRERLQRLRAQGTAARGDGGQRGFLVSRRLRLILLAYLRGYLNPSRPQGIRSILRENVVLGALSADMLGEHLYHSAAANAAIGAGATGMARTDRIRRAAEEIDLARKARELYSEGKEKDRMLKDSKGLVNLFQALEKSGVMGEEIKL